MPDDVSALVFDLPGAGPLLPTGFGPDDYSSVGDYADDLINLPDELGIERCTYVGHSVSGMIGVLASIEHPARLEQLVLLNASPRYLNAEGYVGGFEQAGAIFAWHQADPAHPFINKSGVLAGAELPVAIDLLWEEVFVKNVAPALEPRRKTGTGIRQKLERNRTACFLLHHHCACSNRHSIYNVPDLHSHEFTAT